MPVSKIKFHMSGRDVKKHGQLHSIDIFPQQNSCNSSKETDYKVLVFLTKSD